MLHNALLIKKRHYYSTLKKLDGRQGYKTVVQRQRACLAHVRPRAQNVQDSEDEGEERGEEGEEKEKVEEEEEKDQERERQRKSNHSGTT